IFDFVTEYYYSHPSIAPASAFMVDEATFQSFKKWLGNKDYSYQSDSELLLAELKATAEKEKYLDELKTELDALSAKLSHNKQQDLEQNKVEVINLLQSEIVNRYYHQRGRILNRLKNEDKDLKTALSLINNTKAYQSELQP